MIKFMCLPFGLRNTKNTFQQMMDQLLDNLPYCFVYIDDILIFSPNLTLIFSTSKTFWSCAGFMASQLAWASVNLLFGRLSSLVIASPVLASILFPSTPPPF